MLLRASQSGVPKRMNVSGLTTHRNTEKSSAVMSDEPSVAEPVLADLSMASHFAGFAAAAAAAAVARPARQF